MRRIAIIPARGGSKRLPRKNVLDLGGLPMLAHPVRAARESGLFEKIFVSTEDNEIAAIASKHGAEILSRRGELATDTAPVIHVCQDILAGMKSTLPDFFCCIYATAVFITPDDLRKSEKILHESHGADVVMSVSSFNYHPYKALENKNGFLEPERPEKILMKTNDAPHFVASNGTFYWARSASFLKDPSFYPEKLVGHEIPASRAIDIDTPEDYEWARALMFARKSAA